MCRVHVSFLTVSYWEKMKQGLDEIERTCSVKRLQLIDAFQNPTKQVPHNNVNIHETLKYSMNIGRHSAMTNE